MSISQRRCLVLGALALTVGVACSTNGKRLDAPKEDVTLRAELNAYYDDAKAAFAAGSAEALAGLYDDSLVKPMTKDKVREWGVAFFKEYGPARFVVEHFDVDRVGPESAETTLTYRVDTKDGKGAFTKDGKGAFGGVERDHFVKHGARWYMTAWEKQPEATAK